jgi:hypothetical protein
MISMIADPDPSNNSLISVEPCFALIGGGIEAKYSHESQISTRSTLKQKWCMQSYY